MKAGLNWEADSAAVQADQRKAQAVLGCLFFMWGFCTVLNDMLVSHLKAVFDTNYVDTMGIGNAGQPILLDLGTQGLLTIDGAPIASPPVTEPKFLRPSCLSLEYRRRVTEP